MARKQNERYVRYYTFGSAAAKLEQQRKAALPQYKAPRKRRPIEFDPFAFAGSAVAVLLAVLMIVGFLQLAHTKAQIHDLETRVAVLDQEQQMLQERYESGYDLDEIRIAAHSMGMVEREDAAHVRVNVQTVPQEPQQLDWWDSLMLRLRQFFA